MSHLVMELVSIIWVQEEKGQTLIEYGLIVLLVSIIAIVVLGLLGVQVSDMFSIISAAFSS